MDGPNPAVFTPVTLQPFWLLPDTCSRTAEGFYPHGPAVVVLST